MTPDYADTYAGHLEQLAARGPAAPALVAPGRRAMSFGALARHVVATRAALAAWNIGPGDTVAWPAIDRAATAGALAIVPACATMVPLSSSLTASAYERVLVRARCKAVVLPAGVYHPMREAARNAGVTELTSFSEHGGEVGAFDLALAHETPTLAAPASIDRNVIYVSLTSGTTGHPKLVPVNWTGLALTSSALGRELGMGPGDVSAHISTHHLANGLRTATMLALLNGGAVDVLGEGDLDAFLAAVAAGEVTYTSSPFTMHRELLRRLDGARVRERGCLRFVRIASGRLEPDEMDRLEQALGVPVIAGLSTSETGAIAIQRLPPAPRRRGTVGIPILDEIRIADERGASLPPGAVGEVQVRGPHVCTGYLDDPELNAAAFVDGWFRLGDLGRFDEHGELVLVGRLKETINRGGEKISPLEIDAVMQKVPGVVEAAAFGIPHPALGEEVGAAIVRARGSDVDAAAVIAAVRSVLGERRSPRKVWFVERLPRTEGGKVKRAALAEMAARDEMPSAAATRARAATPLETALAALWAEALRARAPGLDDNFFLLGGDSLRGAKLLTQVNAVFGVDLPVSALFETANTIARMAESIERERAAA